MSITERRGPGWHSLTVNGAQIEFEVSSTGTVSLTITTPNLSSPDPDSEMPWFRAISGEDWDAVSTFIQGQRAEAALPAMAVEEPD